MTFWAAIPSWGCYCDQEGSLADSPDLVRGLFDVLFDGLGIEPKSLQISVKNYFLRWRRFTRSVVDKALRDGKTLSIAAMVGTPHDVHLVARIVLRPMPEWDPHTQSPCTAWLAAESQRWPSERFEPVARAWLRLAAELGNPLSGGVLAAKDLRDAKIELTHEFEGNDEGEVDDERPTSFFSRMRKEPQLTAYWNKIRRAYPITLLGPKFARQIDVAALRAAGATAIEEINGSLVCNAYPRMIEAWSPEFLVATTELRRLLWPLYAGNPADDPDARVCNEN